MKKIKTLQLAVLSGLVACSSVPYEYVTPPARDLASINEALDNPERLHKEVDKLVAGVFHGYLLGQQFLYEFDKKLEEKPAEVMKSEAYYSLLATRVHVEEFEDELTDFYKDMVIVTALPQYRPEQKENAQKALQEIGKFIEGTTHKSLPENLKPMVLSSLRNKQALLYSELKALHDDAAFTNNDPEVQKVLKRNMALLKVSSLSFFKEVKNEKAFNQYFVKKEVLNETVKNEAQSKSYAELAKSISKLSKDIKKFTSELDRGTSSNVIFPSAGKSGTISGSTFPAKTWALTFDDGPGGPTTDVLANLKAKKIPATFFMLAKQAEANPGTVKKLKEAGMDIASHSYTHAQLTKVSASQLEREIGTAKKVIEKQTGLPVKLFRLPYGAGVSVSNVRAKIAEHQLIHVFWNVDTLDWQDKNPQSVFNRTVKQMNASSKNSGVILFHDIHRSTVTASALVMDYLNKQKLTACSVQGVVDQINKGLASCK